MKLSRFSAGALAAILISATFAFASRPALAAQDPRVAQLVAASGQAIGIQALAPVSTIRFDERIAAAGLHGTLVQYVNVRDGRFAETTTLGPVLELDGYDGQVEWSADRTHLVWKDGGDSDRSSELNQAYLENYGLWRPNAGGAAVSRAGTKTVGGHTYEGLRIAPAGSMVPYVLWFDSATHLPARGDFVDGFTTQTMTLSDYRSVGGVKIAHAIHIDSSDGNNSDIAVQSVAFDPPGAVAALERPQTKPTDFSMLDGKTSTTIPIALVENHVYLDVMLNGKGPYHFIFDTGGANIVDTAVAKEIGALSSGSAQGSGVGSQTESFSIANIATLQVGDAVLKDQLFGVAPVRMGFGVSSGRQVDGLIGWEVLARYVTTFDYANRQVVLSMPGTTTPPAGGHVVPFVLYGTQPQIACTIDGIPAECTIDTGARDTISFMSPFLAAHSQVVPAVTTAPGIDGFGVGGPEIGKLGRVQSVGIDDLELTNVVGDYSAQTAGAMAAPFVGANIGGNLLRRFSVAFDYGNGTMTLVPNADYAKPDFYERSGLFLVKQGAGIAVADARPGTPAAQAGIVRGDTIVAVNGTPANTMTLGEIRDLLAQPAGTVVTLQIAAKNGTQRTVRLALRDYV